MKKFISGLLVGAMVLVSMAFAGPVEMKLHEEGYGRIVYNLIVRMKGGEYYRGQGTAIGPHYILTAAHAVHGAESWQTLDGVFVITKRTNLDDAYIQVKAEVVAEGNYKVYQKDWAIIKVKKKLKYWKALEIADAVVGEDVYNISGNHLVYGGPIRVTILVVDPIWYKEDNKPDKMKVYIATPRAVGGDSGSPVLNSNGKLIGIVVGANERMAIIVKGKAFAKKVRKYRGR